MQTTMNYRGTVRYTYSYIKPTVFSRILRFFQAALNHKRK